MNEKLLCAPDPCSSCPYRRDTPPGVWDRSEYEKLPAWDDPMNFAGVFLCHNGNRKFVCHGWLAVHQDNMAVRMSMLTRIDLRGVKETLVPLYKSGAEACAAGLRGIKRPSRKARSVIQKIVLKHAKTLEPQAAEALEKA